MQEEVIKVLRVGTKVKITDMGCIGYIDEIIVTGADNVVYKIVYYHKHAGTWNTVVLPAPAFEVHKDDKDAPKTTIGF